MHFVLPKLGIEVLAIVAQVESTNTLRMLEPQPELRTCNLCLAKLCALPVRRN
jgi:hypothetical protein